MKWSITRYRGNFLASMLWFQVLKNDIDINAEGVAIFTQLLIQYYGYL